MLGFQPMILLFQNNLYFQYQPTEKQVFSKTGVFLEKHTSQCFRVDRETMFINGYMGSHSARPSFFIPDVKTVVNKFRENNILISFLPHRNYGDAVPQTIGCEKFSFLFCFLARCQAKKHSMGFSWMTCGWRDSFFWRREKWIPVFTTTSW